MKSKISDVQALLHLALREDLGGGDITSLAVFPEKHVDTGYIECKETGVIAGLWIAKKVFSILDSKSRFKEYVQDGQEVSAGACLAEVRARSRALHSGERVALNFLQRLSGIATMTHRLVEKVKPYGTQILDTRKTTPGWRRLEKYAVKMGGGVNYRMGLYDKILIKDNHIQAAGGIREAVRRVREKRGANVFVEVEAKTMAQVRVAVSEKVNMVMLDNMTVPQVKRCLQWIAQRTKVEVSGNVTYENVVRYARCRPDYISVGAITHSAPALDICISLKRRCSQTKKQM